MTDMHLLGKYELLESVEDLDLRTFKARQVSTGHIVLCHDLSSGPNLIHLIRLVVRCLRSAPSRNRSLILDMIEEHGSVYLITELLPGSSSLGEWLETVTEGLDVRTTPDFDVEADTLPTTAKATREPLPVSRSGSFHETAPSEPAGDFTRVFRPPGAAKPAEPAQVPSEKTSRSAQDATTLFSVPKVDKVPSLQPTSKPSGEGASPAKPGEFTQLFRAPSRTAGSTPADVPSVVPEKAEPSGERGEFTRAFESYKVSGPVPSSLREPGVTPGQPEPVEFTKIFRAPDLGSGGAGADASPIPVAPQPAEQEGEFTRIFGSGPAKGPTAEKSPPAGQPPEPAPRMAPPAATAAGPGKPEEAASAPSPKQSALPVGLPAIPKVSVPIPNAPKPPARPSVSLPPVPKVPQPKPEMRKPPVPPVAIPPAPRPPAATAASPSGKMSDEHASHWPLILILSGLALAVVCLILFFR